MKAGQKYIDAAMEITEGHWVTYGDLAQRVGVPREAGARAAGQATRWCDDPAIPLWRVFKEGGELPSMHESKAHSKEFWTDLFEPKWQEEGLLEAVGGRRLARTHQRGWIT